jgi:uncharacterized protein
MFDRVALALTLATLVPIPPPPTHYVTDNAGVLRATTIQQLGGELATYHQATGHRILVWIGETTGEDPLEDWTIRAAERWKPGSRQRDDGAILFLFMRDHKIRVEVGYGLESSLTDADASRIIAETIAPQMRAGNVDAAVTGGIDRMLVTITPSFRTTAGMSLPQPVEHSTALAIVVFLGIGLFIVLWIGIFVFALTHQSRGRASSGNDASGWSSSGSSSSDGGMAGGDGGSFGGGGASGSW